MAKKTISIISLGCFRNTYDSERVLNKFLSQGYTFKKETKKADNLVINTCGFIDKAKEESLEVIEEAVRLKKKGRIKKLIVFGCLVQRYQNQLQKFFPEVDQWGGVEKSAEALTARANLLPPFIDFLKICEGCLNRCSYCAIPLIKGPLKSKPLAEIIKEARFLAKKGAKELNLIGQDITSWGQDFKNGPNLAGLVKEILKAAKNIPWIRLIYTHPRHLADEVLDLIADESRICKYIDLPIQHINDRILKAMNRGVTRKQIENLIKKIRAKIPQAVIRTSIIVGFPGETAKEFNELVKFLKEVKFERLGVFTYSREENTPAYDFKNQIPYQTKQKRYGEIMKLQKDIAEEANKKYIGRELEVLVEEEKDGIFIGRSQYDAYEVDGVVFIQKKGLKPGQFYKVKITDAYDYDLVGSLGDE
jgi:ribosomal protein S12 methylthiotransferase